MLPLTWLQHGVPANEGIDRVSAIRCQIGSPSMYAVFDLVKQNAYQNLEAFQPGSLQPARAPEPGLVARSSGRTPKTLFLPHDADDAELSIGEAKADDSQQIGGGRLHRGDKANPHRVSCHETPLNFDLYHGAESVSQ